MRFQTFAAGHCEALCLQPPASLLTPVQAFAGQPQQVQVMLLEFKARHREAPPLSGA